MKVTLSDIIEFLRAEPGSIRGDWEGALDGPGALDGERSNATIAFCGREGAAAAQAIRRTAARVVLVRPSVLGEEQSLPERTLIGSESPRLDFIRVVDQFWPDETLAERAGGSAIVHASATVAPDAFVDGGATIGPGCVIGPGSTIHSGARLYRGTRVGRGVRIDSNAVIGSPGFGFEREPGGGWRRFPQRGAVLIEDEVEIGAGACIDRGALADTVIGRGTKIDNLAYIAHNVVVGRNCLIMASCVIAGSCRIEDEAVISPGASIRNNRTIGAGAHVGMGAVVVADVAPRTVVMGVPARAVRAGTYEGG